MMNLRIPMVRTVAVSSLLVACGVVGIERDSWSVAAERETAAARATHGIGHVARVMTRNLYLGADLTPAIGAPDLGSLVSAAGVVLRGVTATNFPVRAEGLAAEILAAQPDLVGLQEVALWRIGPPSVAPLLGAPMTATTVRYDYLALLLDELNAGELRYQPVVIQDEFDFETPADENGDAGDGPAPIVNAELNARLTMRDVILQRVDAGIRASNPQSGHFAHVLVVPMLGGSLATTRGWTSIDARVRGSLAFRFVNVHLESFHPLIRAQQAGDLVASGGPATGALPVVLVGDLNSDDDTVPVADQQAYRVLTGAGLVERSTGEPSCCIDSSYDLTTGTAAELNRQIDHIMTSAPDVVQLVSSKVTGRVMVNGYWDSDHAGVFSALHIR
jgi:hypothetical protein